MGERSPYICPSLKNVKHELSLVHKSQRREQRDLITRCDVRKGQPYSLICLQIHPPTPPFPLGGPLLTHPPVN